MNVRKAVKKALNRSPRTQPREEVANDMFQLPTSVAVGHVKRENWKRAASQTNGAQPSLTSTTAVALSSGEISR